MLISRVPEDGAGRGEPAGDIARNCQTASELFDLMSKDHDFEAGDDPLSSSDLVLLYKNIDIGNQLMSNVRSNQYVETVYHDDPETDSDLSDSSEELRNIMLTNKERIDLLTNHQPSFNSLSHKLGDLEIQVSNISADLYDDRHFLYKDPYIKEQLQNLQFMSKANEFDMNQVPTSLLDFICCKRLEGNYNFYMDNVITYVTHTIDQLKRISNGDYLPDKVKEKWRESDEIIGDSSKVLSTRTSISMPLQRKTRVTTTWDDIVRTEVDLRSLVKLMERNVVIEVPRMICGSYKFFSKFRADNLVITCERNKKAVGARAKPRVDLVLRVQSAAGGQLASHGDSALLPQLEHRQITQKDCKEVLPLEYPTSEEPSLSPKIIELSNMDENSGDKSSVRSDEFGSLCSISDDRNDNGATMPTIDDSLCPTNRPGSPEKVAQFLTSAARVICTEATFNHATPNDLNINVTNLDPRSLVPKESTLNPYVKAKKKSPERPRVKSPYENKSHILEERKRRKLLEVRERRERKKKASNENSKVSKHKALPQAVSSVTKLSITNKAFYNSIYGRNVNGENANRISVTASNKARNERNAKGIQNLDGVIHEDDLESEGDVEEGGDVISDKSVKKICTNFLDDTETEMSYLQSKQDSDFLRISTSTSVVSNESASNLCAQTDYCSPLTSCNIKRQDSSTGFGKRSMEHDVESIKAQNMLPKNPANSPNGDCDKAPAIECRRSIEKIYTLMQKLHEIETNETTKKKAVASESRRIGSESGTSLKRRVSFSNTINKYEKHPDQLRKERGDDIPAAAVPKVIISAKLPGKTEEKERKTRIPRVKRIPENPLKAISQLLHEFDNVQKNRKIADPKSINRSMSTENTEQPPKIPKRRSRIDSPRKEDLSKIAAKVKTRFGRDERGEAKPALDKKITDLIDEVKEARGEAVRGPPRAGSRLDALARPRRAYVQARAGELPRRQTPDRTARPASHTSRTRRHVPDAHISPTRAPNSSERASKPRQSAASRQGSPKSGHRVPPNSASLAEAAARKLHSLKEAALALPAAPRGGAAPPPSLARAPLLPRDIELSSLASSPVTDEESPQSNSIGIKLHRMVRAMLDEQPASFTDCDSSRGPNSTDPDPMREFACCVSSMELVLVEETGIEEIRNEPHAQSGARNNCSPLNSVTELEHALEHALHRSLSSGAFASRLRVNKLTLSPRPSLQQVMMHESGDTTLLLKSSLHQKIHIISQSPDRTSDLVDMLSTTRGNCTFSGFPLQISTVGFAFPTYQRQLEKITPKIVERDRYGACEEATSCEVSEPPATALLQIKGDKKEEACQCVIGVPRPAETEAVPKVCAPEKDAEATSNQESLECLVNRRNRDEGITSFADQNNDLPSDYTASFDILVGLLNEIQKITTCGCDSVSTETQSEPRGFSPMKIPAQIQVSDDMCKDIHKNCVMLCTSSSNKSSDDSHGIFLPETKSVSAEAMWSKPLCEDKEVLARVQLQQATASTSQLAGHSNDTATSTCTINLPTTSCSVTAQAKNSEIGCNTSIQPDEKLTEQAGLETNRASVKSLVPYYNNIFKVETNNEVSFENSTSLKTRRNASASCNILMKMPVKKNSVPKKCEEVEIQNSKKDMKEFCLNASDFDSTLRVKRDILVTFYSILVLTIFAALAFPEMLQFA